MSIYKVMPYHVLEREDWSVEYLMASLEKDTEGGLPLSDLVAINPSRVNKKEIDKTNTYSYLDLSSISHEYGIITEPKKVLGENLPARATLKVQNGDILLSSVRPERNLVAVVDHSLEGSVVNNSFFVLRPRKPNDTELLYFALRSKVVNDRLKLIARGTAVPTISKKEIEAFQIPDIQITSGSRQTAKTLYQSWNIKRQKKQSVQDIVGNVFVEKGIFKIEEDTVQKEPLFKTISYNQIGDTWSIDTHFSSEESSVRWLEEKYPLKNFIEKARSGAAVSSKEYQEEGIPYIRIKDLTGTGVSMEEGVCIEEITAEKNAKGMVYAEDVLVSRVGTIGKTGFVSEELEGAIASQHISMLQVNKKKMHPLFLLYYLNTSWAVEHLLKFASGTAQKFIRLKDIKELPVPAPAMYTQEEIVQKIERQLKEQTNDTIRLEIQKFTEKLLNKSN